MFCDVKTVKRDFNIHFKYVRSLFIQYKGMNVFEKNVF